MSRIVVKLSANVVVEEGLLSRIGTCLYTWHAPAEKH